MDTTRSMKVLLVEDESLVRASLARRLARRGLEVEAVGGGEEALAAVARALPEVVLTDLSMPGMDGLTLVSRLKEAHPALPVIVMSGHVADELWARLAALEVLRLDKPFGDRELALALEAVLPTSTIAGDVARGAQVHAAEMTRTERGEAQLPR
jgi:two-component system, NtrC family, nitrogen regulation response regulator GlnG